MRKKFEHSRDSEVHAFSREIQRLYASGPVGKSQVKRMLSGLAKTDKGRELIRKTRRKAQIDAFSNGVDFSKVKAHVGEGSTMASAQLSAEAFTTGKLTFGNYMAAQDVELLAHEVTHTIQQSVKK